MKRKADILQKQTIKKGNIIESKEAFIFALLVYHEVDAWYIDWNINAFICS
jgi:hypothetical protein